MCQLTSSCFDLEIYTSSEHKYEKINKSNQPGAFWFWLDVRGFFSLTRGFGLDAI